MSQQIDPDVEKARHDAVIAKAFSQWGPTLTGKVAVVTGGARGIGRTLAEALQMAGAKVVAANKTWTGAESFRRSLEAAGGLALQMDVTDEAQIDAAYRTTIDRFETVDVLINSAGLVSETLFAPKGHVKTLDTADGDWQRMFDVNLFGALKVVRRFIKPMLEQRHGSIIDIVSSGILPVSSGGAYYGLRPGTVEMPYQASKAALSTLDFYLAEEVRSDGVAVNAIMPGHTRASWFEATARAYQEDGMPYFMRPVVPEHIVPITLFLAGQDSSGVTGRLYPVPEWNYDHGFGNYASWRDYWLPADVEQMYGKLEAAAPPYRGRSGTAALAPEAGGVLFSVALANLRREL